MTFPDNDLFEEFLSGVDVVDAFPGLDVRSEQVCSDPMRGRSPGWCSQDRTTMSSEGSS
jgi:hypothetical protein